MIYLHEAQYGEFIRHWANEIEDGQDGFDIATFKILQVDTGVVYDEAIDVLNHKHQYEATGEQIEEEQLSDTDALKLIVGAK